MQNHQKTQKVIEDIQDLFDEHDIRLIGDGNRVKKWKGTKNLNVSLAAAIMRKITPVINMKTNIVYSFTCNMYKGGGEIAHYAKMKKLKKQTLKKLDNSLKNASESD